MSREPSMEEILSSIRRVIARDEAARDAAIAERFGNPADGHGGQEVEADADGSEDVLDLAGLESGDAAGTAPSPDTRGGTANGDRSGDDAMTGAAPAPSLVSPQSAEAARQSIDQLAAALAEGAAPAVRPPAMSGMTIEALAEAALRPMLKQWLDDNLPPLVERLVAQEIARITGKRL